MMSLTKPILLLSPCIYSKEVLCPGNRCRCEVLGKELTAWGNAEDPQVTIDTAYSPLKLEEVVNFYKCICFVFPKPRSHGEQNPLEKRLSYAYKQIIYEAYERNEGNFVINIEYGDTSDCVPRDISKWISPVVLHYNGEQFENLVRLTEKFNDPPLHLQDMGPCGHVAIGLAWTFYAGYLNVAVMPKDWRPWRDAPKFREKFDFVKTVFKSFSKTDGVDPDDPEDNGQGAERVKRVGEAWESFKNEFPLPAGHVLSLVRIIVIPESGIMLKDMTERLGEKLDTSVQERRQWSVKLDVGGVKDRTYQSSVYEIVDTNGVHYHVQVEYATPVRAMYEMSKNQNAGMSREWLVNQTEVFRDNLCNLVGDGDTGFARILELEDKDVPDNAAGKDRRYEMLREEVLKMVKKNPKKENPTYHG